jgi:hypothetical protein
MALSHGELQAHIRALIASGDLPNERPQVHEVSERPAGFRSKHRPTCLICGEPDAVLAYFWIGGRVAYLHAACDAQWKQGRGQVSRRATTHLDPLEADQREGP